MGKASKRNSKPKQRAWPLERQVEMLQSLLDRHEPFPAALLRKGRITLDGLMFNTHGVSIMFKACEYGRVDFAQWLFDNGAGSLATMRTHPPSNSSPLLIACERGHLLLVQWLVAHGAKSSDLTAKDGHGRTALYHACALGALELAQFLFDHGAELDINTPCAIDFPHKLRGATPMFIATHEGHIDMVAWLIDHGAGDVSSVAEDSRGYTPFHQACADCRLDIMKLLFENGAAGHIEHATTELGVTAMIHASMHGDLEIAMWLIENGYTDLESRAHGLHDNTAMHIACQHGPHLDVMKLLFENGASVTVKNETGRTPLESALIQHGDLKVADWLYSVGATDLTQPGLIEGEEGRSLMMKACEGRRLDVCRWLAEKGAKDDVRVADADGHTPMMAACQAGYLDVAKWLYRNGAEETVDTSTGPLSSAQCLDAQRSGVTPMRLAAQAGHKNIVNWLRKKGQAASVDEINKYVAMGYGMMRDDTGMYDQSSELRTQWMDNWAGGDSHADLFLSLQRTAQLECANCSKSGKDAKLLRCAGCTETYYCSRSCQSQDRPAHRTQCSNR